MESSDSQFSEGDLLDAIKLALRLDSDSALASWLGCNRANISAIRSGQHKLSIVHRAKVLDAIGQFGSRPLLDRLDPEVICDDLRSWDEAGNRRLTQQKKGELLLIPDAGHRLVEMAKTVLDLPRDADLAMLIGVDTGSISAVRRKKTGLGLLPRLKLLQAISKDSNLSAASELLANTSKIVLALKTWAEARTDHLPHDPEEFRL